MKFRTKLLCILAVPLMGLVSIAAFAGSDRLDTAQQTGELRDRIGLVAAGVDLVESIGREAATTARSVASTGQERAGLDEARVATDAAVVAWQAAAARAGATGTLTFTTAINRVRESIQVLPTMRQSLDRSLINNSFITSYEQFGVALNDLSDIVAAEATDTALARDTAVVSALAKVELATATEWGMGELLLFRGANNAADFALLQAAVEERGRQTGVFNGLARPEANADFRTTLVGSDVSTSNTIGAELLAAGSEGRLTSSPAAWWQAMTGRMDRLGEVLDRQISALQGRATVAESDAENDFRTFALIAGGIVILSVLLGLVLARSVSGPIRKLTRAAEKLANEQLPALVSGLKSPTEDDQRFLTATLQPLEVRSRDEIGQLAEAFNAVQTVAVDVAAEQAQLLRKGISDIFVNLARRNQVLIDRQIEYLDDIESSEDDPEQLAQLYRLDHLATRMRRNAESLLVLAGHEPSRKRTRPVALVDVVRAALGEVEDYERIDITGFDEVGVAGGAAVDLAHLLAELLENATHFSAPDTRIEVEGRRTRGGYLLSVIDHGIGMAADQLDEANTLLATPPPVGLAIGRSLGFTVVARLSARYGASVRLMAAPAGGVAAIVHLPARLVVDDGEPEASANSMLPLDGPSQLPARPARPSPPPPPPVPPPVSTVPVARGSLPLDRVIDAAWEADLAEFQPADARAGNGQHDHNGNGHDEVDEGNGHRVAPPSPPLARRTPGAALPALEPDRVPPEVTAAGLVRRVPKRSVPTETDPPQEGSEAPGIAASRRSPDDVRAMLARYRSGLQRGRVGDPAPDADTDPEEAP